MDTACSSSLPLAVVSLAVGFSADAQGRIQDVDIDGVTIAYGARVILLTGRPTVILRSSGWTAGLSATLTFGNGIHSCLGADLAHFEFLAVLREFARHPTYALTGPAPRHSCVNQVPVQLPERTTPRERQGGPMQTTTFLDRKLARHFKSWDTDGNGYIERIDFEQAARRMGETFGYAANSHKQRKLYDLCLGIWQGLSKIADTDRDGRIDEAEYKAAFATLVLERPGTFDEAYLPFVDALISIADTDGDGKVDQAEHVRWYSALLGISEKDSTESFRRLDRDGDGFLTREEIREAVREYYFSEDPEAPGNWLLGPM